MIEQKLKYFMENKNFQKRAETKNKAKKDPETSKEPLEVVNGEIIYNPITVEDDELITAYTYLRRKGKLSPRWSKKEDALFYRALECCGTEFSMMETLFPGRTRLNLKHKYNKECRTSAEKVQNALSKFRCFDPMRIKELMKEEKKRP